MTDRPQHDLPGDDAPKARLSRRQVLQAGGTLALGAAMTTPRRAGAIAPAAQVTGGEYHGWWPYQPPPAGHFNSFVADAITMGIYNQLAEMPFAIYKWQEDAYIPLLGTEWELVPPDTFNLTLREGVTWSDGSAFTAQDVVTTFTILRMQNAPVWNYLGSVTATDDFHVVFKMANPSSVVPYYVLRTQIRANSVYGEWATKAQAIFDQYPDPSTPVPADALTALQTEFNAFKLPEMVVSGPYKTDPKSITSSQLEMVKVPTSWLANTVNFDKILLYNQTGPGSIDTLILSGSIDYATSGFPPATEKAMIDQGLRIVRPPTFFGPALYINHAKVTALANPKVRQAIAFAIDKKLNGTVALAESGVPSKYMCGVPDNLIAQWLDQATLDGLTSYEYNLDSAAALMTEAGFTKDGDVWVSPDGERLDYEINVGAENADWATAATNLADQLTAFGVKTTLRTMPAAQWTANLDAGEYQFGIFGWGSGQPHPHFSFYADVIAHNAPTVAGGINYPLQQETSLGPIDLEALTIQCVEGLDKAPQAELVTSLAKAFNELLPIIPLWERLGNDPILENERVTGWPADDDPLFQNSVYGDNFTIAWILDGTLKGVTG